MKKKITLLMAIMIAFLSCEDDNNNNNISNITEQAENGAVVEVLTTTNNSISSDTAEGSLEVRLDYRDGEMEHY